MDWVHELPTKIRIVLIDWTAIWPPLIFMAGTASTLAFQRLRTALRDWAARLSFAALPLLWLPFIPLAIIFGTLPDSEDPIFSPPNGMDVLILVSAIGSIITGLTLLFRARGARVLSLVYVVTNAICCVWSGSVFLTMMDGYWM